MEHQARIKKSCSAARLLGGETCVSAGPRTRCQRSVARLAAAEWCRRRLP
ncbi:hypothetical protein Pd630_LPD07234 [Rhodococcus opacus PD630]|nr:hypothetical protein Pd630_LPD07234 [Rhodococcus opacus PD630]